MHPKKYRIAKAKRRRTYEGILQRKIKEAQEDARKANAGRDQAIRSQKVAEFDKKATEAVTDALLRSRLTLHLLKKEPDRRYRVGLEYIHPRGEYLADPAMAFKDFAYVLGQQPSYCEPRKLPVPEIHVITEGEVNYGMSRDYPELMMMVERCIDYLAKRMVHIILHKFVEQRPR